jgi:transcriptional regulator with XRE-family HTH domain
MGHASHKRNKHRWSDRVTFLVAPGRCTLWLASNKEVEPSMMARMPPTPKALALGAALRKARERNGLTVRELAERVGSDFGSLSRYEKGERTPKPEKVSQILATLGVNGDEYDEIMSLTRDTEGPLWAAVSLPEQRRQVDALLDFEKRATRITTVGPLLIPGLLQTEDYIEAMVSADGVIPPNEVRTRVVVRLGRQQAVLSRQVDPVPLLALIGEAALAQMIGTPSVMVDQMRYLLETGKRTNVTIRIVPFVSGWHPGLEGTFHMLETKPTTVVHLENRRSGVFIHEEPDVAAYRRAVDQVSQAAMS